MLRTLAHRSPLYELFLCLSLYFCKFGSRGTERQTNLLRTMMLFCGRGWIPIHHSKLLWMWVLSNIHLSQWSQKIKFLFVLDDEEEINSFQNFVISTSLFYLKMLQLLSILCSSTLFFYFNMYHFNFPKHSAIYHNVKQINK